MNPLALFGLGFVALVAAVALFFAGESVAAALLFVLGAALDAVAALWHARAHGTRREREARRAVQ